MEWQPNRKQWAAIFATAILALALWIDAAGQGRTRARQQQERFAIAVVILGGMLVWYLSDKRA